MVGCSALFCTNSSEKGFRVFRFPTSNERREVWVKNCQRENWTPLSSSRLCEVHFEDSQYEQNRVDKRKLKNNAIPTVFNYPQPSQIFRKRKRQAQKKFKKKNKEYWDFENSDFEDDDMEIARCCFCYKKTFLNDRIILANNGVHTQFGLTVRILLSVGESTLCSDYCCMECGNDVLSTFEKMIDLNVAAYFTNRKDSMDDSIKKVLKEGCHQCGEKLADVDDYSDHFISHLLLDNSSNTNEVCDILIFEECENESSQVEKVKETAKIKAEEKAAEIDYFGRTEKLHFDHGYAKERKIAHTSRVCHICGKYSYSRPTYNRHLLFHARNPDISLDVFFDERRKNKPLEVDKMISTDLNCEQCDATFTHRGLLFYHYVMVHDCAMPTTLCGRRRPWTCKLCFQKFPSLKQLQAHGREEHNEKCIFPFNCEICKKGYTTIGNLRKHIAIAHLKIAPFNCRFCPRHYLKEENLLRHISLAHQVEDEEPMVVLTTDEVIATLS